MICRFDPCYCLVRLLSFVCQGGKNECMSRPTRFGVRNGSESGYRRCKLYEYLLWNYNFCSCTKSKNIDIQDPRMSPWYNHRGNQFLVSAWSSSKCMRPTDFLNPGRFPKCPTLHCIDCTLFVPLFRVLNSCSKRTVRQQITAMLRFPGGHNP